MKYTYFSCETSTDMTMRSIASEYLFSFPLLLSDKWLGFPLFIHPYHIVSWKKTILQLLLNTVA